VVAEAAVFFACGEVSDAELGQVVLVTQIDFFEREIFFLHFVDTRLHIAVVVHVNRGQPGCNPSA